MTQNSGRPCEFRVQSPCAKGGRAGAAPSCLYSRSRRRANSCMRRRRPVSRSSTSVSAPCDIHDCSVHCRHHRAAPPLAETCTSQKPFGSATLRPPGAPGAECHRASDSGVRASPRAGAPKKIISPKKDPSGRYVVLNRFVHPFHEHLRRPVLDDEEVAVGVALRHHRLPRRRVEGSGRAAGPQTRDPQSWPKFCKLLS